MHQQAEGFTEHEPWDFAATRPDQYPLLLHFPYFDLYRKQVVKQPDLVLAMQLCRDAFTPEQRARNFEYYERITVRDSSLSACTEAVRGGRRRPPAARVRLRRRGGARWTSHDLEHNTRDGLHVAVAGRHLDRAGDGLRRHARPRRRRWRSRRACRTALTRLAFSIRHRGRVPARRRDDARGAVLADPRRRGRIDITHHGEPLTVGREPVVRPIPPAPERPPPQQPPGREPPHRSPG